MKTAIVLAVAAFAVAVSAVGHVAHDIHAYPAYKYSYGVSDKVTGDQKSAFEVRDGAVTKGSYSLVQPDGVLRTVNYISTPHGGFQAQVINKGAAGHPAVYGVGLGAGAGVGYAGIGHAGVGYAGLGHAGLGLGYGGYGLGAGLGLGYGLGAGVVG